MSQALPSPYERALARRRVVIAQLLHLLLQRRRSGSCDPPAPRQAARWCADAAGTVAGAFKAAVLPAVRAAHLAKA